MSEYEENELRHLQMVELRILKEVDRVCRKHGITYFLDSGTALGAIRHDGFIPWDDDVDVGMLRADYDRFLSVAADELGEEFYVTDPASNKNQSALFAKVGLVGTKFYTQETLQAGVKQGIGIDVFAYDVLSADPSIATRQMRTCRLMQSLVYLYHSGSVVLPHKGFLGAVERAACHVAHAALKLFCNREFLVSRFDSAASAGEGNPSSLYFCPAYPVSGSFPKEVLVPVSHHDFEGHLFPVPANAVRYLEIMFGDWQTLPPEDERRQHNPSVIEFAGY